MSHIKRNIAITSLFLVACSISFPMPLHAGIVSFLQGLMGDQAEASVDSQVFSLATMPLLEATPSPDVNFGKGGGDITVVDDSALLPESGVSGTIADIEGAHSTQISLYVVRKGDSLSQIAKMFGVSVNTIIWANDIGKVIREGDKLVILPVSGITHKVLKGETIASIAKKYKADAEEIADFNGLENTAVLAVNSSIIIPDGEMALPAVSSSGVRTTTTLRGAGGPLYEGYYIRPIAGAKKTQGLHGYNGIDLGASTGTPVVAAASGTVIISRLGGYNGGYGNYIAIAHPNGTQTLYAHLSAVSVVQGQSVAQGMIIGKVGSTGRSTGPHLHFEVRGAVNPF